MALLCMGIVLVTALLGIFAPWVAPNDPYANDILNKFDSPSWQYPLGTDHLGRCVFSRMLFGIRPTLFLSLLTMLGTIPSCNIFKASSLRPTRILTTASSAR